MKTIQFTISTKKGESQPLRFGIRQDHPSPGIHHDGGRLQWRNHEGLFDAYQKPAKGIGQAFTAWLLVPVDVAPENTEDFGGAMLAGFTPYRSTVANPGTMTFRGKDLGEMRIHFNFDPAYAFGRPDGAPEIKVRCTERATGAEREAVEKLVCPVLVEFIKRNMPELREEAIAAVKRRFAKEIAEARAQLVELEAKAETAKY